MTHTMKLFGFFLFALTLSFMSCKGEMGDIGATGPAGVAGVDGAAGPAGPAGQDGRDGADGTNGTKGDKGDKGDDGNANVITSAWESIAYSPTSGTFGAYNMNAPEITLEVMDKAVILGYLRASGNVYGIPKVWANPSQVLDARIQEGIYRFQYYATNTWAPPAVEGRYVIIPPAGRVAAEGSTNPKAAVLQEFMDAGVDVEDYDQVAKYLELK